MTDTAQAVLEQALLLRPIERAQLIDEFCRSFDKATLESVAARWAEEVKSRIDVYDAGEIQADPAEAVFSRIDQR